MKCNIFIKKSFLAVVLLFIPSIMVADKIEIQDSTVIIVGKGQTNKNGVFTPNGSASLDSILVDEIVLTYTGKEKHVLSIVDSTSNQQLFSREVKNGMSKSEMENLIFALTIGHTYIIQHGNEKKWSMTIPNPDAGKGEDASNVTSTIEKDNDKEDEEDEGDKDDKEDNEKSYSWLICVIVAICAGTGFLYWHKRNHQKKQKHAQNQQKNESPSIDVENVPVVSGISEECEELEINESNNTNEIAQLLEKVEKGKKHQKQLKRIATLLGLREDQLNLIEQNIKHLKDIENNVRQNKDQTLSSKNPQIESQAPIYEDIYSARDEIAKELLKKFEQRSIFDESIQNAKKRCYVKEPKESEILQFLIDEIAKTLRSLYNQIESASDKNLEPVNDTADVVESESHPEWLNKRLKELFDFCYDESKSVRQNLEQLIIEKTETISDRKRIEETTPNIEIEKVVEEKLTKAKVDWEADAKQDKENALAVKDIEIEGLKRQLKEKDGTVKDLEGQIVDKDEIISKKELIIKDKESVISEKSQIISYRDAELKTLQDRRKQELQTEVETQVNKLQQYTNAIEWRPMLDPCSNDDATLNQCTDIENRLNAKLIEMKERLTEFTTAENALPNLVRTTIQDALVAEITTEESVVNSICRLFAYSNLSFMTDMKREYGVRLRRKNVHEVYKALENLYIQFGINFQIPPLFVMESKDGDYENVTGQAYSELGNLCPNVNNHCDNIDSEMKLKDIIVDIDKIGYAIDGSVQRNARILTF